MQCNSNAKEVFRDLANIFYKMLTILAASVALKSTETGEKLFGQQYTTCVSVVAAIMVYFLVWVLHTLLLQHDPINTFSGFFPISLLLMSCVILSNETAFLIQLLHCCHHFGLMGHCLYSCFLLQFLPRKPTVSENQFFD